MVSGNNANEGLARRVPESAPVTLSVIPHVSENFSSAPERLDGELGSQGAYRLELHQKSICEAKELLQQMREDPYNSLERFKFSAFAVNINKPGEIVGRGVSIQDVRKTVLTAVKVSGSTRKSYRGSRKSRKEPSGSTVSGGNWANRFALLSSSEEEDPRVAPKPRSREPGPSSRTRREPQRNRKPGRAPASSPGHPSSGEASLSSSEVAQERRELQELKAALQKESQAREAAAEALMEKLSQQLQESQQVAEERRASEQRATEERRASEQRAAEERWAAEQLAAETREAARRLAIDKGVAQQLAADERRAEDRRLAQVQLEETLQAVIESQIQKLALVQTSPLGPTESDARGPAAELSGPASETPTSRPGQELVEPASVVTCDVENRGIPSSPEGVWPGALNGFPMVSPPQPAAGASEKEGGLVPWPDEPARVPGGPGGSPEVREEVEALEALEVLESPEAREETGVPEGPEALEEAGVPEGLKAREGPVVIRREIPMMTGMAKATVPSVLSPLLAVLALSGNAR
ncbi:hypothetical protein CYMTET_6380 [Cymbomonas tetramitiformis]|uniref:Uncharacterized protein n=1 Tax=Cymbomonas tetramitiformis TaxID=36881 RepID=A0AAE0GXJ7_9CHLO|nr:hypothetical protein CYMTET_6380 [Cymbomonas tetramitiformis]